MVWPKCRITSKMAYKLGNSNLLTVIEINSMLPPQCDPWKLQTIDPESQKTACDRL